ncbi:PREDICTED: uncharacterized protein LOC109220962 [Nicotiana attenuata]|uniref:uncharacterized protein LOC109220962 n=1 Tax=Nicotiana attenuata TaxID=49451 RepID=UPI00090469FD|nr:PREDICTED: uncharacterized protein LOC109220962 [Nicotiana attenuata]
MEVYINNMLVMSAQAGDHFQHLPDTFEILRKYNMKLNPEKCAFGKASVDQDKNEKQELSNRCEKKKSGTLFDETLSTGLEFQQKSQWASWVNNKVIINNLNKRLDESKSKWPEVLPGVLWAYRTTPKTSTGETPFSLVYGTEALISVEIGEPSTRYTHVIEESNKEKMRMNLDLLEERREAALIRMATQKQIIERYYKRKANPRYFKIWDFVLKKVLQLTKASNAGKLSPNWEGSYRVRGITGKGAYELEAMDGKILPSNWKLFI